MISHAVAHCIEYWPIDKLVFYVRNPRKNDAAVDRMCSSIREFGFKIPILARLPSGPLIENASARSSQLRPGDRGPRRFR